MLPDPAGALPGCCRLQIWRRRPAAAVQQWPSGWLVLWPGGGSCGEDDATLPSSTA
eukprot:COSAG01_NODE_50296_length_364_cov_1.305660_1_plen_55_part_10